MVPGQRGRAALGAGAKGEMRDCGEFHRQLGLKPVAAAGSTQ